MESDFRNADCSRCELGPWVRARHGHACIIAETLEHKRILVIGQNPGSQENYAGRSFVGPSGDLIRGLFAESSVSYTFSNAVKCHSPENREPTLKELDACRSYLIDEILRIKPQTILALGNPALRSLTGKSGVMSYRGAPQELRGEIREALVRSGYSSKLPVVLCSVRPAYVLRTPKAQPLLQEDIIGAQRLARQQNGEEEVRDAEWADASCQDIDFGKLLSWDIETTGLAYRKPGFGVHLIGVDDGIGPVKIFTREQDYERFFKTIQDPEISTTTFNGLTFDEPAMRVRYGASRLLVGDVMPLGYLLDESMPHHNLDSYAIRWLGVAPWKDRKPRTKQNRAEIAEYWAKGPQDEQAWNELKQYNARDTKYTRDLWFKLCEMLSPELLKVYSHLLVPAIQALVRATETGIYLVPENIVPAREWSDGEMRKSLSILKAICEDLWLGFDFNPNSTKQVARVLFTKDAPGVFGLGETPTRYSEKTKLPSVDSESLKTIRARSQDERVVDFCGAKLDYSAAQKMGQFLTGYEAKVEEDGRLHYPYFMAKTETGRSSSPIHTVPRKKMIRRVIGAPPGRKLIVSDLSQIELRLVAWASRDREMLATYREGKNGGDMHTTTAKSIIRLGRGLPRDSEIEFDPIANSNERSLSKGVNFGCVYGAEAPTLRDYLWKVFGIRISLKEAETLRDEIFFGTYSDLIPWYKTVIERLKIEKQVVSPIGRIRRLANIDASDIEVRAEAARQGINTYIQSFGSDLAITSFFLLERDYPQLSPVMFHHDADLFECDEKFAEEGAKIVKHYMEVEALDYMKKHWGIEIDVPILAETKILQEWS